MRVLIAIQGSYGQRMLDNIKKHSLPEWEVSHVIFGSNLPAIIDNPDEFLLDGMEKNKVLINEIKHSPYYNITERIQKLGIREALDDLSKTHLGHFELIKNTLIDYFK